MTDRSTVITYHGVGSTLPEEDPHELLVSEEAFEAQMAFLAGRRNVVPLEAIVEGRPRGRHPSVAITFDDAYRSVLHVASPILSRYGLPSTVFVPTRWIGEKNEWIEPPSQSLEIMDRDELLEAESQGIRIESHGHVHLNYEVAKQDEVETDVRTSVEKLAEILGRPPQYLAYPFGPTTAEVSDIVKRCGLEAAFTLERPHAGRFAWERVWIRPRHGLRIFGLKTSGYWSASWRWSTIGRMGAAAVRPFVNRGR
jgi:peptidoglycan/xylan/chitin deacetylase (PgdA/CDA1 family)